ncbi:arabinose transporter [Sphingomonas sp. AP4-R1]|uniref:arabinose transporter n=1 Tax=Sphingomonas sp. AP4-R1 TaxID=2735134 RepID=UPI0014937A10|nr:arabinose transporter [Sphingomonas sp. AP4-R1]QJU58295.1 arabinose transporter [Sphingomonas sp. AP4-R1]
MSAFPHHPLAIAIMPMACVVFLIFGVIGLAMPVLPLHIHDRLGLPSFVIGLVAGSQFLASLVSRIMAGRFADTRGGKSAIIVGCVAAAASGIVYLCSVDIDWPPIASAAILIMGRGLLGIGESFVITGALAWGLALGGSDNAGKVIAWMGLPMYAAFALAAPLGSALYASFGFAAISLTTAAVPLLGILCVTPFAPVVPKQAPRAGILTVIGYVRLPGIGLSLASLGFGALTIFAALLFAQHGWTSGWAAFTAFSIAFILARLLFGHLPDRVGGAKVALFSSLVEAAGLALIWLAQTPPVAIGGSALAGFGYALVFPALGVEAVRRTPPESRAAAMGSYTAFLDLALGTAGPVFGFVADHSGIGQIYLLSALLVCGSALVAVRLRVERLESQNSQARGMQADQMRDN